MRPLTRDDDLGYQCRACGACCRERRVRVNPYEVYRLARRLGVPTSAFRRDFMQGPMLAHRDGTCIFQTGTACGVREDRPLVCRIYPLAQLVGPSGEEAWALSTRPRSSEGDFDGDGTVRDFLAEQESDRFLHAADVYWELYADLAAAGDVAWDGCGAPPSVWMDVDTMVAPGDHDDAPTRHADAVRDQLRRLTRAD